MKIKSLLFTALTVIGGMINAQVSFVIDSLPDYTPSGDILYIAGDFQGWNPGDPDYALQKNANDKWFIQLDSMAEGTVIKFKFTRGDWTKVEKGPNGEEIPDRQFTYGNGETVSIIIYNWADNSGGSSTAAENVYTIDSVYMPQLNRYRRIWVYLPPDYDDSTGHYPVIYMHDGQNLFDDYTSFVGEWHVDETLNDLYDQGYRVPIVVGIDNGGTERINEYTPWPNPEYGGGQGDQYMQFIVETLKPQVDGQLRTLTDRDNTALWGSSLGGLISHYGALKYQDVFSKAGIYSPSYWFSDSVWMFTQQMGHQQPMRLYQMTGDLEGGSQVADTWAMHDTLTDLGYGENELSTKIIPGGEHNETLWGSDFGEAYLWLFQSYATGIAENSINRTITILPNPVKDRLVFPVLQDKINSVKIFDLSGQMILEEDCVKNQQIDVSNLNRGYYLLRVTTQHSVYSAKFIKN